MWSKASFCKSLKIISTRSFCWIKLSGISQNKMLKCTIAPLTMGNTCIYFQNIDIFKMLMNFQNEDKYSNQIIWWAFNEGPLTKDFWRRSSGEGPSLETLDFIFTISAVQQPFYISFVIKYVVCTILYVLKYWTNLFKVEVHANKQRYTYDISLVQTDKQSQ